MLLVAILSALKSPLPPYPSPQILPSQQGPTQMLLLLQLVYFNDAPLKDSALLPLQGLSDNFQGYLHLSQLGRLGDCQWHPVLLYKPEILLDI